MERMSKPVWESFQFNGCNLFEAVLEGPFAYLELDSRGIEVYGASLDDC